MKKLPQVVLDACENADRCADAHYAAWELLQSIEEPSHEDLEKWLTVRGDFYVAQERFEQMLRQFLDMQST